MADNADIANELMEMRLEGALSGRLTAQAPANDPWCEDCGSEIPTARRHAASWATTCIECQGIRELRARHRR
ncbi:TraR/DksA family transcriptional regulator [Halomonas sp. RA08-2]|uniref:TraR/DksA family transcriptional regulator n=1 Tax=Halomonas sp. RA08-2 TaxID=3440842 RepID=UPI003EEA89AC